MSPSTVQVWTDRDDDVVIAAMLGDKGNPIGPATVESLDAAVSALTDEQALVITGRAGWFTGGLDLGILGAGGAAADTLLAGMGRLLFKVLQSRRPIVVAADGHGVAAGAMLMLAADLAIVSDRPADYGFSEVRSGIPLPAAVIELIAARAHPGARLRLAAHGELVGPHDAVQLGLADEVVPVDTLLDVAVARAAALAVLPAEAYATTKRRVVAPLVEAMSSTTPNS